MILLKIDSRGDLEANWDEIKVLAMAYDSGNQTEDCYRAKLVSLIWEAGYLEAIQNSVKQQNQIALLLSCTGGTA